MRLGVILPVLFTSLFWMFVTCDARADSLETRVTRLEQHINDPSGGATLFLFGAFCALWAQNSGRRAWLWFFLGLLFSVVTLIVLLYKNSTDRARTAQAAAGGA